MVWVSAFHPPTKIDPSIKQKLESQPIIDIILGNKTLDQNIAMNSCPKTEKLE